MIHQTQVMCLMKQGRNLFISYPKYPLGIYLLKICSWLFKIDPKKVDPKW